MNRKKFLKIFLIFVVFLCGYLVGTNPFMYCNFNPWSKMINRINESDFNKSVLRAVEKIVNDPQNQKNKILYQDKDVTEKYREKLKKMYDEKKFDEICKFLKDENLTTQYTIED